MRPVAAAVVQNVEVVAARILKCVGKVRQAVNGTLLIDPFSESDDGGREPSGFDGDGAEGVPKDVTDAIALSLSFRPANPQKPFLLVAETGIRCMGLGIPPPGFYELGERTKLFVVIAGGSFKMN
jgi:hypothetical protein